MPPVLRQSRVLSLHVMWDAGNVRRMRMSAEENKAVLRRLFDEFYNMGNINEGYPSHRKVVCHDGDEHRSLCRR